MQPRTHLIPVWVLSRHCFRGQCKPDGPNTHVLMQTRLRPTSSLVGAKLQPRHDAHRHELLEQQLAGVRHVDLMWMDGRQMSR